VLGTEKIRIYTQVQEIPGLESLPCHGQWPLPTSSSAWIFRLFCKLDIIWNLQLSWASQKHLRGEWSRIYAKGWSNFGIRCSMKGNAGQKHIFILSSTSFLRYDSFRYRFYRHFFRSSFCCLIAAHDLAGTNVSFSYRVIVTIPTYAMFFFPAFCELLCPVVIYTLRYCRYLYLLVGRATAWTHGNDSWVSLNLHIPVFKLTRLYCTFSRLCIIIVNIVNYRKLQCNLKIYTLCNVWITCVGGLLSLPKQVISDYLCT
jgi:hypothetical protein